MSVTIAVCLGAAVLGQAAHGHAQGEEPPDVRQSLPQLGTECLNLVQDGLVIAEAVAGP